MCRLSWNLGASTSWNTQGLSRPVKGLLYLFTYILNRSHTNFKRCNFSLVVILYFILSCCLPLLSAVTKLRRATISYVMSVRPSVIIEQLGSHWMDFHEIWFDYFQKSAEKIQVSLMSDKHNRYFTSTTDTLQAQQILYKHNRYFTWRSVHIYDRISLSSS